MAGVVTPVASTIAEAMPGTTVAHLAEAPPASPGSAVRLPLRASLASPASPKATDSRSLGAPRLTPVITGAPWPGLPSVPGLPAAAISAASGALALNTAAGVFEGPWRLLLRTGHPPRSPGQMKRIDLASLVDRPG
jgi:hypothetical protein